MKLDFDQELDFKFRQFIKYFILSVEAALLYFTFLFYLSGIKELVLLDFISFIGVAYVAYILLKFITDYNILIQIGLYAFIILLYIHVILLSEVFPIMLSLFFLIPLAAYILTTYKSAIRWGIAVFTLGVCTTWLSPFLANLLNIHITINVTERNRLIINYSFIATAFYFAFFMLSFYSDFNNLRIRKYEYLSDAKNDVSFKENDSIESLNLKERNPIIIITEGKTEDKEIEPISIVNQEEDTFEEDNIHISEHIPISAIDKEKFEDLYNKILHFFQEKKPYKDSEYNINKLALSLNTNTTYIYRTLKYIKNTNFKSFLNQYRINEIKEKLNNKEHEKYTLKHIYNNAGFSHQATFNRIFKELEGITPSEYIEKLK